MKNEKLSSPTDRLTITMCSITEHFRLTVTSLNPFASIVQGDMIMDKAKAENVSASENHEVDTESTKTMIPLPPTFSPGPYDVICAKGKKAKEHFGNKRFRSHILNFLEEYSHAQSKFEKTSIVSAVVDSVRKACPRGGCFVKFENGRWYDIGDSLAREKVGQGFRDLLHDQYKSSTRAKRRKIKQQRLEENLDETVSSNDHIRETVQSVERKVDEIGDHAVDAHLLQMFTQANLSILQTIKTDDSLQQKVQQMGENKEGKTTGES